MDTYLALLSFLYVASTGGLGFLGWKLRSRIEHVAAVSGAKPVREERRTELFLLEFMNEVRAIGTDKVHIHDLEVLGRKVLKKVG